MPQATHSLTQLASQPLVQHQLSPPEEPPGIGPLHTHDSQAQPPQPLPVPDGLAVQPSFVVAGQSAGQVALVSPLSQVPLGQVAAPGAQPKSV